MVAGERGHQDFNPGVLDFKTQTLPPTLWMDGKLWDVHMTPSRDSDKLGNTAGASREEKPPPWKTGWGHGEKKVRCDV